MIRMILIASAALAIIFGSGTLSIAKKGGGGGGHSGSGSSRGSSHSLQSDDSGHHVQRHSKEHLGDSGQNRGGHSGMVFNDEGHHHHGNGLFSHNHGDGDDLHDHGEFESGRHGVGEIEIHRSGGHD